MPRDNRCMYLAHVCFYVCCSDYAGVCGNVSCVAAVVIDSVFLAMQCCRMLYGCVRDVMDVVFSVCIVMRGAVGVSVSSCRSCMIISCVHPVEVLNAAFCMTCSFFMLVNLMTDLWEAMSVSFYLPHPVAVSAFIICRGLCACTVCEFLGLS